MARPLDIPLCLRRSLVVQEAAGRRLLGALRWAEDGAQAVRLFFATGVERADFGAESPPESGMRIAAGWGVGRGLALFGEAPGGSGSLRLALRGQVAELATTAPEPEPFAGLDVGLTLCNGEPAETVAEWIDWHVRSAGMTGALILDRRPPGPEADAFADALEAQAAGIAGLKRLMILSSPVPLGLEAPPESHPFTAPDAPGKDRMKVPANDPWTSPFGEPVVYELAKWRFLSRAAGVMNLECCELLLPAPEGVPGVFQAARAAAGGVLALHGGRAFPWRVRVGERPRFADHICRRFDNQDVHHRWCVAPSRAGLNNIWRAVRILNAAPDDAAARPFIRAMALRLPGRATAEIVPKTALVEDPALVAWAETQGHKPVRQPQSPRPARLPRAADAGYTAIVTTMKNEGPFILEWLAYHRVIGVERFLVYTNDCSDGTDALLDLLQSHGVVEHRDNPFRSLGLPPQHGALQAAENEPVIQGAGWAICMDVDEFINIHVGAGRLTDLYAAVGDANLISLTWRLFGNADIDRFDPEFMIAQFTRCAPKVVRKPHQAWGFKTLFRNLRIYKKIGVHRPKGLKPDLWEQIRWVNGSGQPMPKTMLRNGRSRPGAQLLVSHEFQRGRGPLDPAHDPRHARRVRPADGAAGGGGATCGLHRRASREDRQVVRPPGPGGVPRPAYQRAAAATLAPAWAFRGECLSRRARLRAGRGRLLRSGAGFLLHRAAPRQPARGALSLPLSPGRQPPPRHVRRGRAIPPRRLPALPAVRPVPRSPCGTSPARDCRYPGPTRARRAWLSRPRDVQSRRAAPPAGALR
ncbi:MAG: glycosyl transferase family 2 [Alphaproteobacteria bacterium HGW-Alphaproteobacteria-2]|nr:MAG: glycosyl transferase family 2 [Alphaproteobacteria bacterium HGW-Alphaproteobacteria-2]